MATENTVMIALDSIEDLFNDPEPDPWNPNTRFRSGIDEIWLKLREFPLHDPVKIVIQVPPETVTAQDWTSRTRAAVQRYSAAQIETASAEINAIRIGGRNDFILSFIVVISLLTIIALVASLLELEGPLLSAVIAWTGIASWAILWYPVDTFIWGRVPLRREIRQWEKLKSSEIDIRS